MPEIEYHAKRLHEAKSYAEAKEHINQIQAMCKNGSSEAIQALIENGFLHKDEEVSYKSSWNFTRSMRPEDQNKLIEALIQLGITHKNPKAVELTLNVLSSLEVGMVQHTSIGPDPQIIDTLRDINFKGLNTNNLIPFLKNKNATDLKIATQILGLAENKKALPALMSLTGHKNKKVNQAIREAIMQIQGANK